MAAGARVSVEGRVLSLTNLDKVLYPATGTTKAEVLAYYASAAPLLLPWLRDRPLTRKRWPDGVGTSDEPGMVFFEKQLPRGAPEWVLHHPIRHHERTTDYPVCNDLATLTWLGQLAVLELHVPQWRFGDTGEALPPDRLVLDLDPGPGVDLAGCAEVAFRVRDALADLGHDTEPVTSGSKGIHLYARLDGSLNSEEASRLTHDVAERLQRETPGLVTAVMRRADRDGKVFLDWSQNNANKTTIAPWSLRGRERPTVAVPRSWEELVADNLAQLTLPQALERLPDAPAAELADPPDAPAPRPVLRLAGDVRHSGTPAPRLREVRGDSASPALRRAGDVRPDAGFEPMLASPCEDGRLPAGDWRYELKWDGIRVLAHLREGRVRLIGRRGREETARYPDLVDDLAALECHDAVLDGEIVVTDASGAPRFELLQSRINLSQPAEVAHAARSAPAQLMLFDVLALDGRALVDEPYLDRRAALEALVGDSVGRVKAPPYFDGDAGPVIEASRELGLEGVVAKLATSPYLSGRRGTSWRKLKHQLSQAVVVIGWRPGKAGSGDRIGSLLLAVPRDGVLRYAGRVGSGLTQQGLAAATAALTGLERADPAATGVPAQDARDARWVEPVLVAEVRHSERTTSGRLRQPVWKGWRPDLEPDDVVWE